MKPTWKSARTLILAAAALGTLVVASTSAVLATHTSGTVGADLLPDLQTLPPKDVEIVTQRKGRTIQRLLRFDNEVLNAHNGPVELYPVSEDCDGDGNVRNDRAAYQRIYQDANGNGYFERGVDATARVVKLGCMVFHPQHHHWHFENFARYELKPIASDGTVGAPVASSVKVSFCIIDIHRHGGLNGTPESAYYTECGRNSTLGISVGWSDEYHSTLADQNIEITGVPDGVYCLLSTADPSGQIVESDDANNAAGVKIRIDGSVATPRNPTEACG